MDLDKLGDLINNKQIDELFNSNMIDDIFDIELKDDVEDKLLQFQIMHVINLVRCFNNNKVVIDTSDTGCGKTYSACALCKQQDWRPIIICPYSVIASWEEVCKYYDVKPLCIVNYETIKRGKHYDKDGSRVICPFIDADETGFKWKNLNKNNTIIIFDEVHKCKNPNSQNGQLLLSTLQMKHVLLLSATMADKVKDFVCYGKMLGFYNTIHKGRGWLKYHSSDFTTFKEIHKKLFPKFGSRIKISELGDLFPKNQVSAQCYNLEKKDIKDVNEAYKELIQTTKEKDKLANILKIRMYIEQKKLKLLETLTMDYIDNNYSVVIFVNFVDNLKTLFRAFQKRGLNIACIYGEQDKKKRETHIRYFQKNKVNVIIVSMEAGGQSISLHDVEGGHPRVSLICPTYKSIELKQALGRIHRAGAKTPALQRIIFIAKTIEERICIKIKDKLARIDEINNGDLEIGGISNVLNGI